MAESETENCPHHGRFSDFFSCWGLFFISRSLMTMVFQTSVWIIHPLKINFNVLWNMCKYEWMHSSMWKDFYIYIYKLEFTCFVLKFVTLKRLYSLWLQLKTFKRISVLELPIFRIEMTTVITFVCFNSHAIKIQGVSKCSSEDFRNDKAYNKKHFLYRITNITSYLINRKYSMPNPDLCS